MPRKSRDQRLKETSAPAPNSVEELRAERLRGQIRETALKVEQRLIAINKANHDLIPRAEVREMFARVFSAYRQATREIERRYGVEAAAILINAERSALRVKRDEPALGDK